MLLILILNRVGDKILPCGTMQQEPTKTQNYSKEFKLNSAKIHVTVISQS